jgi:hypothetical protein
LTVEPGRAGELVVCHLTTTGMPGEKIVSSIHSGLISSVELFLDLLDEQEKVLAGNRISFRLGFDLWDEVFAIRNGGEHRFDEMEELVAYLADLGPLVVAPQSLLAPTETYQIRAELLLHPIAPSERQKVEKVIGGDNRQPGPGDSQQMTVSLGQLIRFFYKDDTGRDNVQSVVSSRWFRSEELDDDQD